MEVERGGLETVRMGGGMDMTLSEFCFSLFWFWCVRAW